MDFPYKRTNGLFDQYPIHTIFEELKNYKYTINTDSYDILFKTPDGNFKQQFPIIVTEEIKEGLKNNYNIDYNVGDKIFIRFISTRDQYHMDVLIDYFSEEVRVKCKRIDQEQSVYDWYFDNMDKLKETMLQYDREITPYNLREEIFYHYKECNHFKATVVCNLIKMLNIQKDSLMLDFSAGWGDRLLGAIASDIRYIGFDPNTNLKKSHDEIIQTFGDPNRHKIIYEPSELYDMSQIEDVDLVFTSPPFFDLELYTGDNQSVDTNPTYEEWLVYFLFKVIRNTWQTLKMGGYYCLYINDAKEHSIINPMICYMLYRLINIEVCGVLSIFNNDKYMNLPIFIFKKVDNTLSNNRRKLYGETLLKSYPLIYKLMSDI